MAPFGRHLPLNDAGGIIPQLPTIIPNSHSRLWPYNQILAHLLLPSATQLENGSLNGNSGWILEMFLKKTESEQAHSFMFPALPTSFSQMCGKHQKRFPNGCLENWHRESVKIYFTTPHAFNVALSTSRFFALMGTRGRRYSSSQRPSIASAAFTGTGLVSMNRSLKIG